jgi:prepilin-type N-terminal cleavage/methylation domain-containing protein
MVTTFFKFLQARVWRSRRGSNQGFTLLELLVVTLIAGGLVSGLMYLVVELLTADQRDASRNATQQDMQRSLDYMANELREAVYVYPGECIGTAPQPSGCPGLLNHLPDGLSEHVPVLAFWKLQPLPPTLVNLCNASPADDLPQDIPCVTGHSYTLVLYFLETTSPGTVWTGEARVRRYALAQFSYSTGTENTGYVFPIAAQDKKLFANWPFDEEGNPPSGGRPGGTLANWPVLTDFVDSSTSGTAPSCPNDPDTVDDPTTTNVDEGRDYSPSPTTGASSFYACISVANGEIDNQDVLLYLRGNAYKRPGVNTRNEFRPILSTRVLSRGILDINPN